MIIPRRRDVLGIVLLVICLLIASSDRLFVQRFNESTNMQLLSMEDSLTSLTMDALSGSRNASQATVRLPDCQVLIANSGFNFHYEVLESILGLYSLPAATALSLGCNHSSLQFTIAICHGAVAFQQGKSTSWLNYANNTMMEPKKNFYSYVTPGQSRFLHTVVRSPKRAVLVPPLPWDDYAYVIRASCYCFEAMGDLAWLRNDTVRHFCLFHQACEEYANSSQAMWLNPHHERQFFPSLLPEKKYLMEAARSKSLDAGGAAANQTTPATPDRTEHHLCIIGAPSRREYSLVVEYLERYNNSAAFMKTPIQFHSFGIGKMPPGMDPWTHRVQQHGIADFEEYQHKIATTCHAILSLLVSTTHPEYFSMDKKLTGSVVQAAAYRLPIVLHTDLAKLYERYVPDAITHGDDQDSFNDAIRTLLERLETLKQEDIQ
jgi:hypothetical protein